MTQVSFLIIRLHVLVRGKSESAPNQYGSIETDAHGSRRGGTFFWTGGDVGGCCGFGGRVAFLDW
jgi:hypothetical protein